jgi:hypothetical protein
VTEAEWLACADPTPMLVFLRSKASDRKLRLFAVACCRRVGQLLTDDRSQRALGTSERFADALAGEKERKAAQAAVRAARQVVEAAAWAPGAREAPAWAKEEAVRAAAAAVRARAEEAARDAVTWAAQAGAWAQEQVRALRGPAVQASLEVGRRQERRALAALFCDIFGNPFRPSQPLPPAVLAWNDRSITRIAQAIYEDRKLPEGTLDPGRLGILADALLDAGCDEEGLLAHLRGPGPHARGCWAVDLILGKS